MKIIVDAMGGDNAPQAPVMGAIQANKEYGVGITLVGRGEDILKVLEENGIRELPAGVEIAHASEVVEICDNPATAFREKKDSSLTVGLNLLKAGEEGRICFVGNIEAREAVEGAVDVIVADGYSGNIFLKTMEGTGLFLAKEIKGIFVKNLMTKLAAALVSDGLKKFKKLMSSSEVGGTALLGISKPVIKAHGSSDAYAIKNAIRQANQFASSGIIGNISDNIDLMRLDAPEAE